MLDASQPPVEQEPVEGDPSPCPEDEEFFVRPDLAAMEGAIGQDRQVFGWPGGHPKTSHPIWIRSRGNDLRRPNSSCTSMPKNTGILDYIQVYPSIYVYIQVYNVIYLNILEYACIYSDIQFM